MGIKNLFEGILHMGEDFKIMTVSFSDINDRQFTEKLKERLFNHCARMEERQEETNHKNEIKAIRLINKNLENDIKEIKTTLLEMKSLFKESKLKKENMSIFI